MPDDLNLHFKCPIRSIGHFQGLGLGQPNFNSLNIFVFGTLSKAWQLYSVGIEKVGRKKRVIGSAVAQWVKAPNIR